MSGERIMPARSIVVNDKMQSGYKYFLTEPPGKSFDSDFNPELVPKELLALGIFGGKYMNDCKAEFPDDWFDDAKLCEEKHDASINFFGVNASQSLAIWRQKGWISEQDPRGWFQWYCRYYMGRRSADDTRQIKRWIAMKRHVTQVKNNCFCGDFSCRKKQRQALLHWAYDSLSM